MAVSGGSNSMALALLARDWVFRRDGSVLALVVDHGLRAEAAAEAAETRARLQALGIESRLLVLRDLAHGPALAARARAARHSALRASCAGAGIVHLLLGHHAADQAETVMMRYLRGSGPDGLAGMAALVETPWLRLLRPLLDASPAALRSTLRAAGVDWVEDPSNRSAAALRPRLRTALADPDGTGPLVRAHCARAKKLGWERRARDAEDAAWLGRHARLHPEGFAVLLALPGRASPLAAILRLVAGAARAPAERRVAAWLRSPRPATLGGVILRPAGRLAPGGWVMAREAAAMAAPVPVGAGAVWDGRLRVVGPAIGPARAARLPALVRRTLGGLEAGGGGLCWWSETPLAGPGFQPAGMHNPWPLPML